MTRKLAHYFCKCGQTTATITTQDPKDKLNKVANNTKWRVKISLSILGTCLRTGKRRGLKCKTSLIPTLHHLMTRHWRLNSRHIWLEIYLKISNNLKIGQICPRCVQKSLRAPNKLLTGVIGAYFSSFLKYDFHKQNSSSCYGLLLKVWKFRKESFYAQF